MLVAMKTGFFTTTTVFSCLLVVIAPVVKAPLHPIRNDTYRLLAASHRAPSLANPIGPATIPPSTIRPGLVQSPSPIDITSDLVITGNVGGGKHFRGIVPYGSVTEFRDNVGSSTLDSFLRQSAGSPYYETLNRSLIPFYSTSTTVTTTSPTSSAVFGPPTAQIKLQDDTELTTPTQLKANDLTTQAMTGPYRNNTVDTMWQRPTLRFTRPMSISRRELEEVISDEITRYHLGRSAPIHQTGILTDKLKTESITQTLNKATRQTTEGEKLQYYTPTTTELPRPENSQTTDKTAKEAIEITKGIQAQSKASYDQTHWQAEGFYNGKHTQLPQAKELDKTKSNLPGEGKEDLKRGNPPSGEPTQKDISIRAKTLLGKHKTFDSFAQERFDRHLEAAQEYLKQGKFYRAADAYTLASMYSHDDPLALIGKSHALFAAGEYMSSALFLSRALEASPGYAQTKVDLLAIIGDKDTLETRVFDIKQWIQMSQSGELQFLLAYIYYQMDKIQEAKAAIDAAHEKMPEASAVVRLKDAIHGTTK